MNAWMAPIASSNIIYPMWIGSTIINVREIPVNIRATAYEPIKARTMCPALMLAASRNDKVAGRTEILIVSARTRNGFSQSGAPSGRSAAVNDFKFFVIDLMIIANHIGRPNDSVNSRWLEDG